MKTILVISISFLMSILSTQAYPQSSSGAEVASSSEIMLCPNVSSKCDHILVRNSSQQHFPFLFYNKIVGSGHPRYSDFASALTRFSSVEECWLDPAEGASDLSIRYFDWHQIKTVEEVEVCFFRVFDSFMDVGTVKSWLSASGFEIRIEKDHTDTPAYLEGRLKTAYSINAIMAPSTAKNSEQERFSKRILGWFGSAISVSVDFGPRGKIQHVGAVVIRK